MSVSIVDRSTPHLMEAANEFMRDHTSRGKFVFSLVHHDVKEGVYHTLWQISGNPSIPHYGTNRFEDSNGLSSPPILKAEAIFQYLQSNGIQVTVPMGLVEQNAPSLRLAAREFRNGNVREGNRWFFSVHPVIKDGVYYTMWRLSNQPNIPNYGRDRFQDINGLFSTSQEKAQAINAYLISNNIFTDISRDIPPRNNHNDLLEWSNFTGDLEYEASDEPPFQDLFDTCSRCTEQERTIVTLFLGTVVAATAGFATIAHLVTRALRPS